MRWFVLIISLVVLGGCRSPQTTFMNQVNHSVSPLTFEQLDGFESQELNTIEEMVEFGLTNNPEITAALHRIEAIQFRIPQNLELPDPTVNTITHLSPVETAAGRQEFALGVNQKVVNVDRRATQAAIVLEEVRIANAELETKRLNLAERIRNASHDLLFVREAIRISNEDASALKRIESITLKQFEVNRNVTQQDVLNVQLEQSTLENNITELKSREKLLEARLNRAMGLAPSRSVLFNVQMDVSSLGFELDSLTQKALDSRPELQSQMAKIRRQQRKVCLANLQHKPDFNVGLNWISTDSEGLSPVANGDDALMLGVGFNLPVRKRRIDAAICEAKANRRAAETEMLAVQDNIREEVFQSVAILENLSVTIELLRDDIVPKAERIFDLSVEDYANEKSEFSVLMDQWRDLLKYRLALAKMKTQQNQTIASLTRQVGQMELLGNSYFVDAEESLDQPSVEPDGPEN